MTPDTLVRDLDLESALYGYHASAQNCGNLLPDAMQFYVQLCAD